MSSALKGVKILDLTRVLAGPFCTMVLGDLGANVIKVEAPGGSDETRNWGPPFQEGVSAYYLCANRNKRSLTVDLKTREGKEIIYRLVKDSDVIIHNFKTGTMERLGFGYEELSSIHPGLVYCSITGFGETGPYRDLPGYDYIIQAMSGLMSITGTEQSGPQKVGVAITDLITGLYACIGIQAALYEKEQSGVGQKIDLALYDSAISSLVNVASNYLMSAEIPKQLGNMHPNIVPYQTFDTSDGKIVIAVGSDRQFQTFCSLLQMEHLGTDERYVTNADRVENHLSLIPILQKEIGKRTTHYWREACDQSGIPNGPIHHMEELFADPQVKAREMRVKMTHPEAGEIHVVGSPLKLSKTPVQMNLHPPRAGEHTNDILEQLGYSSAEITAFKKDQMI